MYDDSWEVPHVAGTDPNWQESDCYWFLDRASGVGGYHRIGQHPVTGTGEVLLFAYFQDGQRFRRQRDYNAGDCQRGDRGQSAGTHFSEFLGDGRVRFGWNETESAAELVFEEAFYTPRSWMKDEDHDRGASAVKQQMNTGGHLEVSGRMCGQVRIGDRTIEVDALAHRDRSWGCRDYKSAWQHRMVTGTVGPALSWASFIMQLSSGQVARAGFVARHGETFDLRSVDTYCELDYDGLSLTGLRAHLSLEDGSTVDLEGAAAQGFVMLTEGWLLSSHHFVPLTIAGESGFTIVDLTNRPCRGTTAPSAQDVSTACFADGLSDSLLPLQPAEKSSV